MFNLDENYYLRKCYFKRNQVPTQIGNEEQNVQTRRCLL